MTSRLVLLLPEAAQEIQKTIDSLTDRQLSTAPITVRHDQNVDESVREILDGAAEQKLECLRLIVLRRGDRVDDAQWNREQKIAHSVAQACQQGQVRFIRGVIADASVTVLDEKSFHVGWDFNLIIEPEDSIGEVGFLAAPVGDDNGAASVASASALIGGIFEFLSEGILDGWKESAADSLLRVRLARWHLRIVDVRDLTGEVVELALNEGAHWHKPDELASHPNSESAVSKLAQQTAEVLRFRYQRLPSIGAPQRFRLGIFAALRLYFRRLGQMMSRIVQTMSDELRDAFNESTSSLAQGMTFGPDSRVQVVIGELNDDEFLPLSHHWRDKQLRNCEANLPNPIPEPETWETLRSVMLGVADGGDFEHEMLGKELDYQDSRAVVTDPGVIVELNPPPFEVSDAEAAMLRLDDHTRAIDTYDAVTVNILDRAIESLAKSSVSDPTSDLKVRFQLWTQKNRTCFAGQLSDHMGKEGLAAYDDFARYDREWVGLEQELENAADEELKSRRRLRNLAIGLLAALVLPAIVTLLASDGSLVKPFETNSFRPSWLPVVPPSWGLFLILMAIWLIVAIVLIIRMAREQVRAEHRVAQLATRPKEVFELRQNSLHEFARLSYLSDQFADWATALSVVLHEPHGTTSLTPTKTDWMDDHPLRCLAIGSPSVSQDTKSAAAMGIRKKIVRQGWLSEAFRSQSDRVRRRYSQLMHVPLEQVKFESDTSTYSDPVQVPGTDETLLSPRSQLRKELVERRHSEAAREELVGSLSDLSPTELSELVDFVQSSVADLNGRRVHEFVEPLTSLDYQPNFASRYGGGSLTPNDMAVETSWAGSTFSKFDINRESKIVVGRDLIAAYRLQISRSFYPSELEIMERSPMVTESPMVGDQIDGSDEVG